MGKICNHPLKLIKNVNDLEDDICEDEKIRLTTVVRKLEQFDPESIEDLYQSSCKIEAILKLLVSYFF